MDFSKIEFNPMLVNDGEFIWDKYPELGNNPAFCTIPKEQIIAGMRQKDLSQIVSFVILYVDFNSPFYKETDIDQRMKSCAKAMSIKADSFAWEEIASHTPLYSKILYEYFRLVNSILFEDWLSLKTTLSEFYKYLRTPISPENMDSEAERRSRVQKNIEGLKQKVLEAEAKLFPTKSLQDQINRENIRESLIGFAEQFALHHPSLNKS